MLMHKLEDSHRYAVVFVALIWIIVGEKHLSTFFGDTKDLTPEERGKHLETDTVRKFIIYYSTIG